MTPPSGESRAKGGEPTLFGELPAFPPALPPDELELLAKLPSWPTQLELHQSEEAVAKRLKARGLVKIEWAKSDPIAIFRTGYAGKLPAATIRLTPPEPA